MFPGSATILVDTYDTLRAVERLTKSGGSKVSAVRLDSGDLRQLSIQVREILDRGGMSATKIFASGDLNEYRIQKLLQEGAAIDSFGVGTELATSYDAPALSAVYKLVGLEQDGRIAMRIKLSDDKSTYPGIKQVWRRLDSKGTMTGDLIALSSEPSPANENGSVWQPLLQPALHKGKLLDTYEYLSDVDKQPVATRRNLRLTSLERARANATAWRERLPASLRVLEPADPYPVSISEPLLAARLDLESSIRATQSVPRR